MSNLWFQFVMDFEGQQYRPLLLGGLWSADLNHVKIIKCENKIKKF